MNRGAGVVVDAARAAHGARDATQKGTGHSQHDRHHKRQDGHNQKPRSHPSLDVTTDKHPVDDDDELPNISRSMPSTAFIPHDEQKANGKDKKRAVNGIKTALGKDSDNQNDSDVTKDGDEQDEGLGGHARGKPISRSDREDKEIQQAYKRVEEYMSEQNDHQYKEQNGKPERSQTQAEESQAPYLDTNQPKARESKNLEPSYPLTGHPPDHTYQAARGGEQGIRQRHLEQDDKAAQQPPSHTEHSDGFTSETVSPRQNLAPSQPTLLIADELNRQGQPTWQNAGYEYNPAQVSRQLHDSPDEVTGFNFHTGQSSQKLYDSPEQQIAPLPSQGQSDYQSQHQPHHEQHSHGTHGHDRNHDDREALPERHPEPGENGEVPEAVAAPKHEERPGPRNEIVLQPRLSKIQYHTVSASDVHLKASHIPLNVSADGESECLPNGTPYAHAGDQDDVWTSTREREREILGVHRPKTHQDKEADYSDEKIMSGSKAQAVAEYNRQHREGGTTKDVPHRHHTLPGKFGQKVPDKAGSGSSKLPHGMSDHHAAHGEISSHNVGEPVETIPKAESSRREELISANQNPYAGKRPKNQRLWSTMRTDGPSLPDKFQQNLFPQQQQRDFRDSASPGRPGPPERPQRSQTELLHSGRNSMISMQGAFDADKMYEEPRSTGHQKWAVLRQKLLHRNTTSKDVENVASSPAQLPLTNELMAGQLPVMILKTWMDRDEVGHKAVPILLGSLRFRVGDSANLGGKNSKQAGREIFRIECEYGDGAVKWVVYRELRDFVSLHTHYKADNFGSRVSHPNSSRAIEIPEFPKTFIPYLSKFRGKLEGKEGKMIQEALFHDSENTDENKPANEQAQGINRKGMSRQDVSKECRVALQRYLLDLIRAVMFRSEANRLCRFFELSSLTLALAPRGGFQGKAGFLRLMGSQASKRANQPGLKPMSWGNHRKPKWCIVRESYLVASDGPESTEFYDVFLFDSDFVIERPRRALRHGLKAVTGQGSVKALLGYNARQGEFDEETDQVTKDLNEIAAAAGSGQALTEEQKKKLGDKYAAATEVDSRDASQHTFYIINSQIRLKLVAKNVRQMQQFIVSMERVASQSVWAKRNRFDSFAPIRMNVAAQWLVDGRDYFWNLSRALNMAKDRVYIHDWWISPELYLRRPGNERYRLDNLLKRKAEEGVKIFLIIYNEVSDKTTPTDSTYTKKRLMGLHPNIMVQRSPSHFQTGTFYWSHHEKLCVIDETIAFMGGLDLCFGRWDTSQHVLIDDDYEPGAVGANGPIWPGKDMANERVIEFHTLNKPFEDMFDRTKVPRMPWHDVGLQIVGQPARDLCRHFVQRWNHLIRTKNHTMPMPFLSPPADFTDMELKTFGLKGTCEIQICRSCGPWSMGTATSVEHSIQNAYLKAIHLSDHFVYIENQFFITSTVVDGVEIQNRIGDAIVDRIIRAHKAGTKWKACVMIPLLPGYTFPIDTAEASSVRLILECQNRTICRGTQSIFSRLKKEGIDPNEYISFFSLRGWGKFKSGALTTEQVYIHGKTMIVDDRTVICGSANINERSQMGDRDSELAAVIRDTDMIDSTMAGKPYKVGRFAHSLRVRLMREHVGIDVDAIEEDELIGRSPIANEEDLQKWDPDHEQAHGEKVMPGRTTVRRENARGQLMRTLQSIARSTTKGMGGNVVNDFKRAADVVIKPIALVKAHDNIIASSGPDGDDSERQDIDRHGQITAGFASSVVPTLEEKTLLERRPSAKHSNGKPLFTVLDEDEGQGEEDVSEARLTKDEKQDMIDKPVDRTNTKSGSRTAPKISGIANEHEKFGVPANATDEDDSVPNKGTERADESEVEKQAVKARTNLRKHLSAKVGASPWTMPTPTPLLQADQFNDPLDDKFWKDQWVATAVHNTEIYRKVFRCIPDDLVTSWASYKAYATHAEKFNKVPTDIATPDHEPTKVTHDHGGTHGAGGGGSGGGIVGQEGVEQSDAASHVRSNDIVDGQPRDHFLPDTESLLSGEYDDHEHHLHNPFHRKTKTGIDYHQSSSKRDGHDSHKREGHGSGGGGSGGGHVEGRHGGAAHRQHGSGGKHSRTPSAVPEEEGEPHLHRQPSKHHEAWADWEKEEMESLLEEVRGHLVVYPTRFLESEDAANNFLFNSDRILPLLIYN